MATAIPSKGMLNNQKAGLPWILHAVAHVKGSADAAKLEKAIKMKLAEGIDWKSILGVLLPLVISLFFGGSFDIQKIIDLINGLL